MNERLLERHAAELRERVAALAIGLSDPDADASRRAAAHRLRGSALVLGLDGLSVAVAAYEAALDDRRDQEAAQRAAELARHELDRALVPEAHRSLGHDLRNDLNIVLLGSKLLEAELAEADHRELAQRIALAAERMAGRLADPDGHVVTPAPRIASAGSAEGLSVLLVEDDALVAEVVARMLATAGARVEAVAGLGEARAALSRREYDAAVVDLHLSDGSGADLIPTLGERGIRAVVLTGEGPSEVAGADRVLGKPVDGALLAAAVAGHAPT